MDGPSPYMLDVNYPVEALESSVKKHFESIERDFPLHDNLRPPFAKRLVEFSKKLKNLASLHLLLQNTLERN